MASTYVIQAGDGPDGPVKIGHTKGCPRQRMRMLQTGNAEKLYLVRDFRDESGEGERHLHRRFERYRVAGEWFSRDVLFLLGGDIYEEDEDDVAPNLYLVTT